MTKFIDTLFKVVKLGGTLAALAALGCVVYFGFWAYHKAAEFTATPIQVPTVELPKIKLPEVELPKVKVEMPEIKLKAPSIDLSGVFGGGKDDQTSEGVRREAEQRAEVEARRQRAAVLPIRANEAIEINAKGYAFLRDANKCDAFVWEPDEHKWHPLRVRSDLMGRRSDPYAGLDWGDTSEGSARLAVTLLADAGGDDARAVQFHGQFRDEVVAYLPRVKEFQLRARDVIRWARDIERTNPDGRCKP